MHLDTSRLHLREFGLDDFADVFAYESDPEVVQFVAFGPYSAEECQRDLRWHVQHQRATPRHFFHLALTLPATQRVIGWCGVQFDRADQYEAELGYALHRDFWGQGYMTEAARAVVSHSFRAMGVQRVFAECRPENIGSIRVLEKLGMTREGHLRQNRSFKRRVWDTLIYGLLVDEWRAAST